MQMKEENTAKPDQKTEELVQDSEEVKKIIYLAGRMLLAIAIAGVLVGVKAKYDDSPDGNIAEFSLLVGWMILFTFSEKFAKANLYLAMVIISGILSVLGGFFKQLWETQVIPKGQNLPTTTFKSNVEKIRRRRSKKSIKIED